MTRSSHSNALYHAVDSHCEFLHHKVYRDKLKSGTDGTVLQLPHHHKQYYSNENKKIGKYTTALLC